MERQISKSSLLSKVSLFGPIFTPKIPSIKITDLAKAMAPNYKIKYIGIRPGEKMHELLFSKDESINVIDYKNYYIIKPAINLFEKNYSYITNQKKEKGKKIKYGFEYSSETNSMFLNISEIKKIMKKWLFHMENIKYITKILKR